MRGAYLGLTSLTIDGSLSALNLPGQAAARSCRACRRAPPAAKAGIRGGTISTTSKTARSRSAATSSSRSTANRSTAPKTSPTTIGAKKPGDTVTIELQRANGKGGYEDKTVTVTLGSAAQLGPEPEHARRLGRATAPAAAGHAAAVPRWPAPRARRSSARGAVPRRLAAAREDLRHHEPRRRRAGRRARRLGARHDLLRAAARAAARSRRRGAIAAALRRRVELCGVFVNAPLEEIARDSEELGLTLLQLHGDEGPSFCAEAARRTGARVIKAAQVAGAGRRARPRALPRRLPPARRARARPARASLRGGTGETFDWGLARGAPLAGAADPQRRPATPSNVAEAIAAHAPVRGRQRQRHRGGARAQGPRAAARASSPRSGRRPPTTAAGAARGRAARVERGA